MHVPSAADVPGVLDYVAGIIRSHPAHRRGGGGGLLNHHNRMHISDGFQKVAAAEKVPLANAFSCPARAP